MTNLMKSRKGWTLMGEQTRKGYCEDKAVTSCTMCTSEHQEEFGTEMNIHFQGLKNVDHPGVLVFPRLLVCLDCGFSWFTIPEAELAMLATRTPTSEASTPQAIAGDVALRRRIAL